MFGKLSPDEREAAKGYNHYKCVESLHIHDESESGQCRYHADYVAPDRPY